MITFMDMEEHLNVVLFFQYYKLYIFLYMCSR